jgi:hypothetical protein
MAKHSSGLSATAAVQSKAAQTPSQLTCLSEEVNSASRMKISPSTSHIRLLSSKYVCIAFGHINLQFYLPSLTTAHSGPLVTLANHRPKEQYPTKPPQHPTPLSHLLRLPQHQPWHLVGLLNSEPPLFLADSMTIICPLLPPSWSVQVLNGEQNGPSYHTTNLTLGPR